MSLNRHIEISLFQVELDHIKVIYI